MSTHQHERWQLRPSAKGGVYCAACGDPVEAELHWGVRDKGLGWSKVVALHPTRESAEQAVDAHPDWYELLCSPYPEDPRGSWFEPA